MRWGIRFGRVGEVVVVKKKVWHERIPLRAREGYPLLRADDGDGYVGTWKLRLHKCWYVSGTSLWNKVRRRVRVLQQ